MTLLDFGQTMRNMQSSLSLSHGDPRIKVCNECHSNLTNTAPHSSITPQVLESINRPMTWQVLKTCTALQMPHRAVFWANLSTRTWRSNVTGRNRRCQLCLWLACAFLAFQCSEILSNLGLFQPMWKTPTKTGSSWRANCKVWKLARSSRSRHWTLLLSRGSYSNWRGLMTDWGGRSRIWMLWSNDWF